MSVSTYRTRHIGLAAMLHFALGEAAHISTYRIEDRRFEFVFSDPEGKCPTISEDFFSPQGALVDNAKKLLEASHVVHLSIQAASANRGLWENTQI